jgi:polygalacturonase
MTNNPAQGMTLAQLTAQAQTQFGSAYNQYAQQGMNQAMSAQQYNSLLHAQPRSHHMWVWNGVAMDVVDFARHAYGDTPEATHFILKYKDVL